MNKMFALLRLAMELNFPGLTVDCLEACTANEKLLIEFEEIVLRSGMPMPEIWTRVERLRQAYCYLPYPQLVPSAKDQVERGLDSQRFFNNIIYYQHGTGKFQSKILLFYLNTITWNYYSKHVIYKILNNKLISFLWIDNHVQKHKLT